jgi:hypothetical protein
MGGLLLHLLHEPGSLDHVGEARIVLDVGGGGELAAGLNTLDHDRVEHGARRIDRRRIAGRSRADDHDLGVGGFAHRLNSSVAAGFEARIDPPKAPKAGCGL